MLSFHPAGAKSKIKPNAANTQGSVTHPLARNLKIMPNAASSQGSVTRRVLSQGLQTERKQPSSLSEKTRTNIQKNVTLCHKTTKQTFSNTKQIKWDSFISKSNRCNFNRNDIENNLYRATSPAFLVGERGKLAEYQR
jgi:hypothetical protein